jgi:Rieske Fe-S protein
MEYTELVTPGDVGSAAEIEPGRGAVIRRGLTKVAVYKDQSGVVHERSAICRHLGCVVGWNTLESTWDCPCHGSRYDAYGVVIQGPANGDLTEVENVEKDSASVVRR